MNDDSTAAPQEGRGTCEVSPLIVGIGASAGGLQAIKEFLGRIPPDNGMAFVLLQHIGASERSLLSGLLDKMTAMPVVEIGSDTRLAPNRVHVAPPNVIVKLGQARFRVRPPRSPNERRGSIDLFFRSLADEGGARAVGIVLSGTGTDGTLGLEAIGNAGGMTMAQAPDSAAHADMPSSAVMTGVADHVLPPAELASALLLYAQHRRDSAAADPARAGEEVAARIPQICGLLRERTGHDFKHYKTSTLVRRIQRRMQVLHLSDPEFYLTRLGADPQETQLLFRELLIGVTAFFRDPEGFEALRDSVLRPLLSAQPPRQELRVWVPGCATGEEAYSIAMLVREAANGLEQSPSIQIFATDIDERALNIARRGFYPQGIATQIPAERLNRFFVKQGRRYQVSKEIRELCLFSAHNLISDPPLSRMDLISCRNLLIYLGPPLQKKLFSVFHYALKPGGYLFLGSSETLTGHAELFRPVDARHRIAQRKETALRASESLPEFGGTGFTPWRITAAAGVPDLASIAQRIVLDEFAPRYAIVGEEGQIIHLSEGMARYVEMPTGSFSNSIVRMARQGLRVGLRAAFNEALKTRRTVTHETLSVKTERGLQQVRLTVQPMPELGQETGMFMFVFQDMGPVRERRARADAGARSGDADAVIDQLERELLRTREDLERTVQDLEAANEELKSSNEELRSMNEELQSANEELETSKEEVQAANDALAKANADLQNLLRSTRIATIFLDRDGGIRSFTPAAAELYNLIATDVGRPLGHVTHRFLTLPPLPPLDRIEARADAVEQEAQTVDGRWFLRRLLPYRTPEGLADGLVMTFLDITGLKQTQEALRASEEQVRRQLIELEALYRNAPIGLALLSPDLRYLRINDRLASINGIPAEAHVGRTVGEIVPALADLAEPLFRRAIETGEPVLDIEIQGETVAQPNVERVWLESAFPLMAPDGAMLGIGVTVQEITERKRAEGALQAAVAEKERLLGHKEILLKELNHRIKNSLQLISSLLALQSRNVAEEARRQLGDATNRINAVARVHQRLYQGTDIHRVAFGQYLRDFGADLADTLSTQGRPVRLLVEAAEVELPTDLVIPLALIVNELVTNAIKYAFAGQPGGTIRVRTRLDLDGTLEITVADDGVGLPEGFCPDRSSGLGMTLVNAMADQINATIELPTAAGGAMFRVRLPNAVGA